MAGFATYDKGAGISGNTVYADNVDFTGTGRTNTVTTNGQLLIGATNPNAGGNHINVGLITSPLGTVTVGYSDPNITLDIAGGGAAVEHLTADIGGKLDPVANNFNIYGNGSIGTSGSGDTITISLNGLTNHSVLVGAATSTITKVGPTATAGQVLQSAGAAADPAFSTATYPSTTTANQILYSSSNNVVTGLATANQGVLTTGLTGIPVITPLAVNGQVIIGSTAGVPAAATITAGIGISITNASNSITIAATGSGFTWVDATSATQALVAETGYVTDRSAGVVYTLPATGVLGDTIKIVGKLGLATITPNANQQIVMGSASGTVGVAGTAVATNAGDSVEYVVITAGANTVWRASNFVGNWTLN